MVGSKFNFQTKVTCASKPNEFVSFRKLLLNKCQQEFEKDKEYERAMVRRQEEINDADSVCQ